MSCKMRESDSVTVSKSSRPVHPRQGRRNRTSDLGRARTHNGTSTGREIRREAGGANQRARNSGARAAARAARGKGAIGANAAIPPPPPPPPRHARARSRRGAVHGATVGGGLAACLDGQSDGEGEGKRRAEIEKGETVASGGVPRRSVGEEKHRESEAEAIPVYMTRFGGEAGEAKKN